MLIFPLKKEWYEKIRSGEKTIEYREVKPYWCRRFCTVARDRSFKPYTWETMPSKEKLIGLAENFDNLPCRLRYGYTKRYITASVTKIEIVDGKDTDLAIDKPVYAIHLADVRKEE